VVPGADVELAVGGILRRVSHPALTGLRIVEAPVTLREGAPTALPDLFFGEELVVMGRYRGAGRGTLVIEGERLGRRERIDVVADFPASTRANAFIPPIWAARRIGDLTRTLRLEGANPRLVTEIRTLGQRYGILTEYTSYLVHEPGLVLSNANRQPQTVAPSAQSGRDAFERAEASAALSKTATASDMANQVQSAMGRLAGAGQTVRSAGGRIFRAEGDAWTDVSHSDSLRVIAIAPYSAAWFAVAEAMPELREPMALGERVTIAGRRNSVRIVPGGASSISPTALARLVQEFRGS
jgi:Ca-activated chloride channel family protein